MTKRFTKFFHSIFLATFTWLFFFAPTAIQANANLQNGYCWNDQIGWIDFGGVTYNDANRQLTGIATFANGNYQNGILANGQIDFTPQGSLIVTADENLTGEGYRLQGQAFSEQIGWIWGDQSSTPAQIKSDGTLQGNFWSDQVGWIECSDSVVNTAYAHRFDLNTPTTNPPVSTPTSNGGGGSASSQQYYPQAIPQQSPVGCTFKDPSLYGRTGLNPDSIIFRVNGVDSPYTQQTIQTHNSGNIREIQLAADGTKNNLPVGRNVVVCSIENTKKKRRGEQFWITVKAPITPAIATESNTNTPLQTTILPSTETSRPATCEYKTAKAMPPLNKNFNQQYPGLSTEHPAYSDSQRLWEQGLITTDSLDLDSLINRAEVAKIITNVRQDLILKDPQCRAAVFTDVQNTDWFFPYIESVYQHGIMNGFPDNSFHPEWNINQVEMLKILVLAQNLTVDQPSRNDAFWYTPYWRALNQKHSAPDWFQNKAGTTKLTRGEVYGLIQLYFGEGLPQTCARQQLAPITQTVDRFSKTHQNYQNHDAYFAAQQLWQKGFIHNDDLGLDRPINRAEVAKILAYQMQASVLTDSACQPSTLIDMSHTDWYFPYVEALQQQNILNGYADNTFRANTTMNKVELAKLLVRVHQLPQPASQPNQPWYQAFLETLNAADMSPAWFTNLPADHQMNRGEVFRLLAQ